MPEESALEKVLRLSRVVVPAHDRRNPKSGKLDHVDTYTYERHGALGSIKARAGRFHSAARVDAPAAPRSNQPVPKLITKPVAKPTPVMPAAAEAEPPRGRKGKKLPISPEEKVKIRAKLAANPVNSKNILQMYDQATDQEKVTGKNWYPNAHAIAVQMAKSHGVSVRQAAGMIAAYSPQTAWGKNLIEANEVLRTGQGIGGPGAHSMIFRKPSDPAETRMGMMAPRTSKIRADAILAGKDFQDVFAGKRTKAGKLPPNALKIRAFGELIARGQQDPNADLPAVVIDRHAAGVARGVRFTDNDYNIDGPSDSMKKFSVYAQAYRDAATELSKREGRKVTPEEVQATTWLARQRLNMSDVKSRKKLGERDQDEALSYFASYEPTIAEIVDDPMTGYAIIKAPGSGRTRPPASGSLNDPIDVRGNLDQAVQFLTEGLHVRLNQPSEVALLADRVQKYVDQMKAKGAKTPNINLCNVTVPGTNLFCHDTKGIPRIKMPQLWGAPRPGSKIYDRRDSRGRVDVSEDFQKSLEAAGVKVEPTTVPAINLKATQNELDSAKVAVLLDRVRNPAPGQDPPIFVSRDNYVIDGHHRWAAHIVVDSADNKLGDQMLSVLKVDMDIGQVLDYANWFTAELGIQQENMAGAANPLVSRLDNPLAHHADTGVKLSCAPYPDEPEEELDESALQRVIRLTRALHDDSALQRVELAMKEVVVPRHERRNPITGKIEDVDTYSYMRRSKVEGTEARTAVSGTYRSSPLQPSVKPPSGSDEATNLAFELNDRAVAAESEVSETMANLVHGSSGDLTGLEFRLKTKESLARKIKSRVKEGMTPREAANSITDALRYTGTWQPSEFAKGAQTTIDQLRQRGYKVKVKNYWASPLADSNPYRGINLSLVTPNGGLHVELQLHTPATFEKKNGRMHKLYEEFRVAETKAEQDRLWKTMWDEMSDAETPPGASSIT